MAYVLAVPVDHGSDDVLLFEVDRLEISDDLVLASNRVEGMADRARVTLETALEKLKPSLSKISNMLRDISPDEAVMELSLKVGGETGIIVAKGNADANFTIRLSWKKAE